MKNEEEVYLWPDGTWCFEEDLEETLMSPCTMSDDFKKVPYSEAIKDE